MMIRWGEIVLIIDKQLQYIYNNTTVICTLSVDDKLAAGAVFLHILELSMSPPAAAPALWSGGGSGPQLYKYFLHNRRMVKNWMHLSPPSPSSDPIK